MPCFVFCFVLLFSPLPHFLPESAKRFRNRGVRKKNAKSRPGFFPRARMGRAEGGLQMGWRPCGFIPGIVQSCPVFGIAPRHHCRQQSVKRCPICIPVIRPAYIGWPFLFFCIADPPSRGQAICNCHRQIGSANDQLRAKEK